MIRWSLAMLSVAIVALAGPAVAQMYKWVDKAGKTHYSDQPPPADAREQAAPSAAAGPALAPAPPGRFRPEEEAAAGVMCGMALLQFGCMLEVKRFCTMDEMVKGVPGTGFKGAEGDPNRDPNYRYAVAIRGTDITFTATPRRAGLAGFFNDGEGSRYSESGPASASDKRVMNGNNCKGFTK